MDMPLESSELDKHAELVLPRRLNGHADRRLDHLEHLDDLEQQGVPSNVPTAESAPAKTSALLVRVLGAVALLLVLASPFLRTLWGAAPAAVTWEEAKVRQIARTTIASGVFKYKRAANLSPDIVGRVAQLHVDKGQTVARGDVVLSLNAEPARAEVNQQSAAVAVARIAVSERKRALAQAERELQRSQKLLGHGALAATKLDDARDARERAHIALDESRGQLTQAVATLDRATEQLSKLSLRAPIDGTVLSVDIKLGETASPSSSSNTGPGVMTIADTNSFIAEVYVDEADITQVQLGQEVRIYTTANPDDTVIAHVSSIPLTAMAAKNSSMLPGQGSTRASSYAVEATVDGAHASLLPGMTFRAEIVTTEREPTLTVPVQALLSSDPHQGFPRSPDQRNTLKKAKPEHEENHVFIVKDGVAHKRKVEVGPSDDQYVEIRTGIQHGDVVVFGPYKALRSLTEGQKVKQGDNS